MEISEKGSAGLFYDASNLLILASRVLKWLICH